MTDEMRAEIANELTVPLWPVAGRVLRLSRNATYEGAKRGDIPTIPVGKLKRVSTAWLRKTVGMEAA